MNKKKKVFLPTDPKKFGDVTGNKHIFFFGLSYIVTVYYFHTLNGHSRFGIPSMAGAVRSKVSYLTEYFCTNVFDWLKFLADQSKL